MIKDAKQTLEKGISFPYFHENIWKTGYFNKEKNIFVGTIENRVTTVINKMRKNYIQNLKNKKP